MDDPRVFLNYRVLVVGGGYDYIKMMFELGFQGAKDPEEADIILFTGGEDVHPSWYDEKPLKGTFSNLDRDRMEKVIFDNARENNIPMVGICRGGQFLNVMCGGAMWQDVTNHCGNHMIKDLTNPKKPTTLEVTSTHHQMMIPTKKAQVLAVGVAADGNSLADVRCSWSKEVATRNPKQYPDYEVLYYPEYRVLCFQPHPEFARAPKECRDYFSQLLETYITPYA